MMKSLSLLGLTCLLANIVMGSAKSGQPSTITRIRVKPKDSAKSTTDEAVSQSLYDDMAQEGLPKDIPDEQRLLNKLLSNYDPASRPVYNASSTVTVKFGLTLIQILDMDEKNQILTTNVWLEQEWTDERLVWDPEQYNGLKVFRIPAQRVWLPDTVLYNSADDYTEGFMQSKVMVKHTGNVFWPPPARLRSSCKVDITYFPFDKQVCSMKFGSWTYDGLQVNITNRSEEVDLQNYITSGEWEITSINVKRNDKTYGCCPEPYPDVTFSFGLARRSLFYMYNIIFPCIGLTSLSLLVFWLPSNSGEKITLGITVLLAFSVFMLQIADNIPSTSEFVPILGIYLVVTMALTSLNLVLIVFILQLHDIGPHQRRVPRWIRKVVIDVIARILCMETTLGNYYGRSYMHKKNLKPCKEQVSLTSKGDDIYCREMQHLRGNCNNVKAPGLKFDKLSEHLNIVIKQLDESKDVQEEINNEWKLVAIIFERFLFWLFFMCSMISTVSVLVMMRT